MILNDLEIDNLRMEICLARKNAEVLSKKYKKMDEDDISEEFYIMSKSLSVWETYCQYCLTGKWVQNEKEKNKN